MPPACAALMCVRAGSGTGCAGSGGGVRAVGDAGACDHCADAAPRRALRPLRHHCHLLLARSVLQAAAT
eukprot:2695088-Rhodomonas_salina.1